MHKEEMDAQYQDHYAHLSYPQPPALLDDLGILGW
jgi:hypothetical protein